MSQCSYLKEKVHAIRGALSVLSGFVCSHTPQDDDERSYLDAAKSSLKKLRTAVEEIDKSLLAKNEVDAE